MLRSACTRALTLRTPLSSSSSSQSVRNFTRSAVSCQATPSTSSASSSSTGGGFNWQKLITVWDPPSKAARFRQIDSELAALRMESRGAPSEVKPIDWSYWEQNITDKAAVAAIKREYETMKYETPEGLDLKEVNSKLDTQISRAEKAVPRSQEEITNLRQKVVQVLKDKETMYYWNTIDWFDRYPGLEKQIFDRYENGWQLPTDAEEKISEMDFGQLKENFKKGVRTNRDDLIGLPTAFGDIDFAKRQAEYDAKQDSLYAGDQEYEDQKAIKMQERAKFADKLAHAGDEATRHP